MKGYRALIIVVFAAITLLARADLSLAQSPISVYDAAKYVGKVAMVCGKVASANYAAGSKGRPTFLNLDRPYPNHMFTALIWGENRGRFSIPPEKAYSDQKICVTGMISTYRGVPQIVVHDPSQIGRFD